MSAFRTIKDAAQVSQPGGEIYFHPLKEKQLQELPTVWLDLHIGGSQYYRYDDPKHPLPFDRDQTSQEQYIWLPPGQGVRLKTEEKVRVDNHHCAIVTNVASRAIEGLTVAPGKVDPGYGPGHLVLVVFNQSSHARRIRVGEKVAALAFCKTDDECRPTSSQGHEDTQPPDPEPDWLVRQYHRLMNLLDGHQVAPAVITGLATLMGSVAGSLITVFATWWLSQP